VDHLPSRALRAALTASSTSAFIALSRECQYFFVGRIYRFKGLT
jgi:hypothetical protein